MIARFSKSSAAIAALLEPSDPDIGLIVAQAYAWTGQIDAAFDALIMAIEAKQPRGEGGIVRWNLGNISLQLRNPVFRQLHNDPRWQQLLEKNGISAKQLAELQFKVTLPK